MNATEWLTQNALKIAGVELVVILALLLFSPYGPGGETRTRVRVDTTREVVTDTNWITVRDTQHVEAPTPDSTLRAARIDTVVRNDTVYVSSTPPIQRYRQAYSGAYYEALVTSWTTGTLDSQRVEVSVDRPEITTRIETRIDRRETTIRDPWELTAGGMVGGNRSSFATLAPGLGLRTPAGLTVQYHYDLLSELHLVSLHRSILSR